MEIFTRCGTFHKGNIAHTPVVCSSYVWGGTSGSGSCFMYANLEMCILPPLNSTFKMPDEHPMKQSWLRGNREEGDGDGCYEPWPRQEDQESCSWSRGARNHDQEELGTMTKTRMPHNHVHDQEEPRSKWWQWVLGTSIPTRGSELLLGITTSISTRQSKLRIDKKAMMMNTRTMTKRY